MCTQQFYIKLVVFIHQLISQATEGDDLGLAKLLIENGASVNHRGNKNETPLQISVAKGEFNNFK